MMGNLREMLLVRVNINDLASGAENMTANYLTEVVEAANSSLAELEAAGIPATRACTSPLAHPVQPAVPNHGYYISALVIQAETLWVSEIRPNCRSDRPREFPLA